MSKNNLSKNINVKFKKSKNSFIFYYNYRQIRKNRLITVITDAIKLLSIRKFAIRRLRTRQQKLKFRKLTLVEKPITFWRHQKLRFGVELARDIPVYPRLLMNLSRNILTLTRYMPDGFDTISNTIFKFETKYWFNIFVYVN